MLNRLRAIKKSIVESAKTPTLKIVANQQRPKAINKPEPKFSLDDLQYTL